MRRRCLLCVVSCLLATATIATAQTSFPMITHVHPVAVQRGKSAEVTVTGQMNFAGAYKILFDGNGVTAEVLGASEAKASSGRKRQTSSDVKLKVTVAADANLGVREFRIASNLGISSVGQLVIVDDPVVVEQASNNIREQAQPLTLACVAAGKLEVVEDVDFYKFDAQAHQNITFELHCARLQDRIHDLQKHAKPMITLYDATGRELAANDHFYFADPMLSYKIQTTGTYYLQIRESTYDGDQRWVYALHATTKPYVSHVYPMAGNPGKKIDVEPVGSAKLTKPKVMLDVPSTVGAQQVQFDLGGFKTNPATFYVSHLPQSLEQEPNDTPDKATRVTVPGGINGRIGIKRDLDHHVFALTKGKAMRFELKARRFGTLLNSSLHGVLEILNPKGAVLATNDATHSQAEASLTFTAPADGDYLLRVRDLNSKGGDSFVYHVEADWALPDFTFKVDPDKAMIGPGSSTAWYVHVNRINGFTGPVKIEVQGLPKDVTASPLTIPAPMTQGLVVITANPAAAKQAFFVDIIGTTQAKIDGKETTLTRKAVTKQEIYSPGGGRAVFDVNTQVIAVTDPSDILKVEINTREVILTPGGEAKIDVTILRRADYDKTISLDVLHQHLGSIFGNPLPPGVTIDAGKSKTLLGTGSQGHIVLKCAANAEPIEGVPISVLCHVSINFVVKVSYASQPILVSVRKK